MYNGLLDLNSNCETLRKVLKVDLHLYSKAHSCWAAQILDGFQGGLQRCIDCAVNKVLLKEWIREKQTSNWPHTKHSLPGYLHLDLPQHVMQNVSRFRLRAHTLSVETASWEDEVSPVCDRCLCGQIQDESHALFV
eukprot:1159123-Pelagomonas_calceolata.AAC.5